MVGLSGLAMLIIWVMIARNPPFELGGMMGVWSGPLCGADLHLFCFHPHGAMVGLGG